MTRIRTPCNKVCQADSQGVCIGCYRTVDEIANWLFMTPEERDTIIKRVKEKRNAAR